MNHIGKFDPSAMKAQQQQPHQFAAQPGQLPFDPSQFNGGQAAPITSPTLRDVLNGRGQGVQRHPGNVKYRTLVFVNKGLYAKCPRTDKMKISKGIVAAVRELGGRFLELDERTNIYRDIGDKKATEKTSQALREGQTKIRKQLYKDEEKAGGAPGFEPGVPMPTQREISAEGYFGYSVQVLESLYNSDEMGADDTPQPTSVAAVMAKQPPQAIAPQAVQSANFGASNAAMAMALDQFPGAVAPAAQMPSLPPPSAEEAAAAAAALDTRGSFGIGRFTHSSLRVTETGRPSIGRLTNMSMGSIFSVNSLRNLLESARATDFNNADDGLATVLTKEICDLVRQSERELIEVERMMDDGSSSRESHEDKEVNIPDGDAMDEDRVSELRMTDVARDAPKYTGGDTSKINENERDSLMDESVLTFGSEDMTTVARGTRSGPDKVAASADAELLLRFSDGKTEAEQAAV